mgnify:FL=1
MNSIMKAMRDALRSRKREAREKERQEAEQAAAEAAEKKRLSDHRIATKEAAINGTEPPPPLEVKEEPVVEVEPEPEAP